MTREEARQMIESMGKYLSEGNPIWETEPVKEATRMAIEALQSDRPTGSWISRIDNDTWMLECSACGCRVQEEKYRIAVGENATKCPYCGAELGLGGFFT